MVTGFTTTAEGAQKIPSPAVKAGRERSIGRKILWEPALVTPLEADRLPPRLNVTADSAPLASQDLTGIRQHAEVSAGTG
jgi:hypothetical protein